MNHDLESMRKAVATTLTKIGVSFFPAGTPENQTDLDFFLPDSGAYVLIGAAEATNVSERMATQSNVFVLQGEEAVRFFVRTLFQIVQQRNQIAQLKVALLDEPEAGFAPFNTPAKQVGPPPPVALPQGRPRPGSDERPGGTRR